MDGDGVLDGVEVGTVGSPRNAVYRTRPDLSDTDADGLGDNQGDSNRVTVQCATSPSSSASSTGPDASDPKSFCKDPAGPGLQPLREK